MKKLFRIDATAVKSFTVWAEDEEEAMEVADDELMSMMGDHDWECSDAVSYEIEKPTEFDVKDVVNEEDGPLPEDE